MQRSTGPTQLAVREKNERSFISFHQRIKQKNEILTNWRTLKVEDEAKQQSMLFLGVSVKEYILLGGREIMVHVVGTL